MPTPTSAASQASRPDQESSPGGGQANIVAYRAWREDGVWNVVASDFPIAVFGHSHGDALVKFGEACRQHFEIANA